MLSFYYPGVIATNRFSIFGKQMGKPSQDGIQQPNNKPTENVGTVSGNDSVHCVQQRRMLTIHVPHTK